MFGLFKRVAPPPPPPSRPVEPQAFCTRCGGRMVQSFIWDSERFSPTTGRKERQRYDGIVCERAAGGYYYDGSTFNHDGVYRSAYDRNGYWAEK